MAQNLPNEQELKDRAAAGIPLSREEVADITRAEQDVAGQTVRGGPAATAQSLYTKQQDFFKKTSNVMSQPVEQITKEEANQVESAEVRSSWPLPGWMSCAVQHKYGTRCDSALYHRLVPWEVFPQRP